MNRKPILGVMVNFVDIVHWEILGELAVCVYRHCLWIDRAQIWHYFKKAHIYTQARFGLKNIMTMKTMHLDTAAEIRKGEELDLEKLNSYLREKHTEIGEVKSVRQFHGGFSNLTYQLETSDKAYVLRRPPIGANIKTAHDMEREFRLLGMIRKDYLKVPRPILYCGENEVIGNEFYIMEKITGVILKPHPKIAGKIPSTLSKKIAENTISELTNIHSINLKKTGLSKIGKPEGYVERQVSGWSKRYINAQTDEVAPIDFLLKWLPDNIPNIFRPGFIHNDFKLDNLILNPNKMEEIVAVLDWEMATVGDTLMDLGLAMCYWVEKTDYPVIKKINPYLALSENISREEALDLYFQKKGEEPVNMLFYYAFGCFKLAVVLQQIYARYAKGFNKNPIVAGFPHILAGIAENGMKAVKLGRISALS